MASAQLENGVAVASDADDGAGDEAATRAESSDAHEDADGARVATGPGGDPSASDVQVFKLQKKPGGPVLEGSFCNHGHFSHFFDTWLMNVKKKRINRFTAYELNDEEREMLSFPPTKTRVYYQYFSVKGLPPTEFYGCGLGSTQILAKWAACRELVLRLFNAGLVTPFLYKSIVGEPDHTKAAAKNNKKKRRREFKTAIANLDRLEQCLSLEDIPVWFLDQTGLDQHGVAKRRPSEEVLTRVRAVVDRCRQEFLDEYTEANATDTRKRKGESSSEDVQVANTSSLDDSVETNGGEGPSSSPKRARLTEDGVSADGAEADGRPNGMQPAAKKGKIETDDKKPWRLKDTKTKGTKGKSPDSDVEVIAEYPSSSRIHVITLDDDEPTKVASNAAQGWNGARAVVDGKSPLISPEGRRAENERNAATVERDGIIPLSNKTSSKGVVSKPLNNEPVAESSTPKAIPPTIVTQSLYATEIKASEELGVIPVLAALPMADTIRKLKVRYRRRFEEFDQSIWDHYECNIQNDFTFTWKMEVRSKLLEVIQRVFPEAQLMAVGSTVNGCGSYNSDMDLCLCVPHRTLGYNTDRDYGMKVLDKVRPAIVYRSGGIVNSCSAIPAKVPILKLTMSQPYNELEVDMNCNNVAGIYNSHLIHYYARVDDRFPALCLVVKHWAIVEGINDAMNGTFNSYSLILMVLHYLQCGVVPAVLPNLQGLFPHKFDGLCDLQNLVLFLPVGPLPKRELNKSSVGELLIGFFDYYARFDFAHIAISVRRGRIFSREELPQDTTRRYRIFIEEPYDLCNTARCVTRLECIRAIRGAFSRARHAFLAGQAGAPKLANIGVTVYGDEH